jgi:RNA polymerase sigma factor (sigma-70 family)
MLPLRLLATQSDARLVELAGQGHERAFEALLERYRKPLLGYTRRRLLLPESRAEDALQQAFLSAWLALQQGVEVKDARAWLYRIAHNAAVSAWRRSGYDHDELSDAFHGAAGPEEELARRSVMRQTLIGLAGLPELQRDALLRTAVEGESYERVAAELVARLATIHLQTAAPDRRVAASSVGPVAPPLCPPCVLATRRPDLAVSVTRRTT